MVFPLGPEEETDEESGEEESEGDGERTTLTDKEITHMLKEVNCVVRKIVHGRTARHVYFWAADNKARTGAIDMGYKLKGKYAPEKHVGVVVNIDAKKKQKIDEILGLTD
jgi:hypothetical protein